MDFSFSTEQAELQQRVRRLAEDQILPIADEATRWTGLIGVDEHGVAFGGGEALSDHRLVLGGVIPFPGLVAAFELKQYDAHGGPIPVAGFDARAQKDHLATVLRDRWLGNVLIGPESLFVTDTMKHAHEIPWHISLPYILVRLSGAGIARGRR